MNKTRSAIRNYIEWLPKQSIWIFIFHLPILFLLYVVRFAHHKHIQRR